MLEISGGPGTGKTKKLIEAAYETGAIVVCSNPKGMLNKANSYGIPNVNFISYEDFYQSPDPSKRYMIDEIGNLYENFDLITGYTITKE